jgi:acetylornithine deacetylase/succinyl-diaminopimelate desuccinylase-like protein
MQKELLTNLSHLVNLETTSDNPEKIREAFSYIDEQLQAIHPFIKKEYTHNGVLSVIWSTKDTLNPDTILNAHIDVVPASKGMFQIQQKDGKLIGRGTSDMKFSIVSFIHALKQLHQEVGLENVSIAVMITSDEEKGGFNGVKHLVNDIGYRSNLVILPDAGDGWRIAIAAKGASWIKLSTSGSSAHASRPWEGESAVDKLLDVLSQLRKKYPNPTDEKYVTTNNIGIISGGTTPNQIADSASATLDIRYTADLTVDDIIKYIKLEFPEVEIERLVDKTNFKVDPQNSFIQQWLNLVEKEQPDLIDKNDSFTSEHGGADHHYFTDHGMPILATKPNGGLIHTENEWLDEEEFYLYAKLLALYLIEMNINYLSK